jgi:hypothetical protein
MQNEQNRAESMARCPQISTDDLCRTVENRRRRLAKLIDLDAPATILNKEKALIWEAEEAVFIRCMNYLIATEKNKKSQ